MRFRFIFSFMFLLSLGLGVNGQEPKKDPAKAIDPTPEKKADRSSGSLLSQAPLPDEVDVQFLNGSKVRMQIQTEKLEVETAFGKLQVPIKDIRSIEFGLRMPDEFAGGIEAAVKGLASSDYRTREKSTKALIEFGPYSYPAVLEISKSKDIEAATRAKEILQQLKKNHSKGDLRVNNDDRIDTTHFTIVGRIVTKSVVTKARYFGIVQHELANLRSLKAIGRPGVEIELSIDAAKYAVQGQWLATEFDVDGRSALVITAKGTVDTWPQQPGQWMAGPAGVRNQGVVVFGGNGARVNQQMHGGALLGKIGENGTPFLVGERYEATSEIEGKLYLSIGPSPWGCESTGKYDVTIKRKSE